MYWDQVRFKQRLLRITLRYAQQHIPAYSEQFRDIPSGELRLEDFPIVDKATINNDLAAYTNLERFPDFLLTSGGSSGELSIIPGSVDEVEYSHRFNTGMRTGEFYDPSEFDGFTLHLERNDHGTLPNAIHGQPVIACPFYYSVHAKLIRKLLEEGLVVGGRRLPVVNLMGSLGKLKRLTAYLLQTGYDFEDSTVRSVVSYGMHLSEVWRERIFEIWGAETHDRYGLTEFFHDVPTECEECGAYHFAKSHCEVFSPDGAKPICEGAGVLVVTTLCPFVRLMPRIRYWTNDLVQIGPYCETAGGELGVSFLGRFDSCLLIESGSGHEAIFGPSDAIEVLDAIPDLGNNDDWVRDFYLESGESLSAPWPVGAPVHNLKIQSENGRPARAKLVVEVNFDPTAQPGSAKKMEGEIMERIDQVVPSMIAKAAAHDIEFGVELVPPDGLRAMGLRSERG